MNLRLMKVRAANPDTSFLLGYVDGDWGLTIRTGNVLRREDIRLGTEVFALSLEDLRDLTGFEGLRDLEQRLLFQVE